MDTKLDRETKVKWYLPDNALNKSPGWNTFRVHVRDRFPSFRNKTLPVCVINDVLRDYGGKFSSEPRISRVDFDSEKHYTLFILKFGELK